MTLDQFGGRRFLLTVISGAGTWLLCCLGKISGDVYSVVTIATVAAYITAGTTQKFISAKQDGSVDPAPKKPDA